MLKLPDPMRRDKRMGGVHVNELFSIDEPKTRGLASKRVSHACRHRHWKRATNEGREEERM